MGFTRFAPSPTGFLHLGHVVNAIHVWGLGHSLGAPVILRIEDHDRERSKPEYERALLDDLDWLGFVPDQFSTDTFRRGACEARQSDRNAIYERHASRLIREGRVYGCVCSRQQLAAQRATGEDTALAYPGTCRTLAIPPTTGVAWRVRLDDVETERLEELLAPSLGSDRAGDPVIRDRRGNWTYQFAVTVDDFEQNVDLVIRGRDLIDSTALQVRLATLLGRRQPPRFAHHGLVMRSAAEKLSKSAGDTGVSALRAAGLAPDDVIGRAARLVALQAENRPVSASGVASLFGLFQANR